MTDGKPWGATPQDWAHFADKLRLEDDLLPVVSNPKAKISERSKMRDLGKTPSRYDGKGEVVGIPAWTQHVTTSGDLKRWVRHSDYGICVQTRSVRAIDIDIADPAAAAKVRDLIELGLGALPRRARTGTGKCLLALRMPGDFAKRIIRTEHGLIEFLATGQQFIAVGTHPSGARYEWVDADGVIGLPDAIPEVTPAEFEVLWQALVEQFALPDGDTRVRNGIMPSRPRTATDLDDTTVAWLRENGWVREFDHSGRVDIRCPWEHEHTTDSGPSATSYFPAGVGGFEQGHFRCLHAHCAGRTDGDFLEALGLVADEFAVVEAQAGPGEVAPLPAFTRDKQGRIEAALNNVLAALTRPDLTGVQVAWDDFKGCAMIADDGAWRRVTDADYTRLRSMLEARSFKPIGRELMRDAVQLHALNHRFDSAKQWAATLSWDGVPRVETFLHDYFGVKDTPYHRAVSLYIWTALAGRVIEPGCKADMTPVLIGAQGAGKTSAVMALSPTPDAFVEVDLTRKDDDISRMLCGRLVGEIAELKGLHGRDAEHIKAFISRTHEEWIEKWQTTPTKFPRRLMMFGTGNNREFLDDETGERRWLPVRVGEVDVVAIGAVRDQLWAEGIALFEMGGVAWSDAQHLAHEQHHHFKVTDPWQDAVEDWLERDAMDDADSAKKRKHAPIRTLDVLVSAIGLRLDSIQKREEMRIGRVLTKLGYTRKQVWLDGRNQKVWVEVDRTTRVDRSE